MKTRIQMVTTWKAGEITSDDKPRTLTTNFEAEGDSRHLAAKLLGIAREELIGRGIEHETADWTRTEIIGALIEDLTGDGEP